MDNIVYTTPEEQIEKLNSQNLIIEEYDMAIAALSSYGYSNLIKSYRDPYFIKSDSGNSYRSGVTFNQIFSLYMLDKNLRNAVIAAMLDLEEHLKEQAADVIAKAFGIHQDDYLSFRNYQNKKKSKPRFMLRGIIDTMKNELNTGKDPIHHYKVEHGIVPPWILFKGIYFSTIINFVDKFKKNEKNELVHRLYNLEDLGITEDNARKLMMDSFYLASDYRNLAAHGGRIYNYVSDKKLRTDEIFDNPESVSHVGFSQLLIVLSFFKYTGPYNHIKNILDREVNRHCIEYPQDVTYLCQILNMNIVHKRIVYVTEGKKKYHNSPYCSGMKNAHQIGYDEAISRGYEPCKKCRN